MTLPNAESFTPLSAVPAGRSPGEFRVTVIPGAGVAKPFHALDQQLPASGKETSGRNCEPRVMVQRDGDRITHLRIQCSCGQVLDLACVYNESSAQA